MNEGDTFRRTAGSHVWVVVSDPRRDLKKVVIANMTTVRHNSDRSCVVQAGEHSFVKHETCMMYAGAKTVAAGDLSDFTPLSIIQVLTDQGLVSDPG